MRRSDRPYTLSRLKYIDLYTQFLGENQVHRWRSGCKFSFDTLSTPQKWYALYALQYSKSEPPSWEDVVVPARNSIASNAQYNNTVQKLEALGSVAIERASPLDNADMTSDALLLSGTLHVGHDLGRDALLMPMGSLDISIYGILQQLTTLLRGSQTQNLVIMQHIDNHQHQNTTNLMFEQQIQKLRDDVEALRNSKEMSVTEERNDLLRREDMEIDQ
jgi:hypothetical protein